MNIAKTVVYFQDKFEQAFTEAVKANTRNKENGVNKVKELEKI